MNKIDTNLALVYYKQKPPKNEVGKVSNIVAASPGSFTIKEIAEAQGSGCPSTAGYFPSRIRDNNHWAGQQLLELDFDEGHTIEYTTSKSREYGFDWNYIYPSSSYTVELQKHRMVFCLPEKVIDIRQIKYFILALLELFPESDQRCKDPARMYFGGNRGYIPNGEFWQELRVDPAQIVHQLNIHFNKMDADTKYKRVKRFCQEVGVDIVDGLPAVKVIDEMWGLNPSKIDDFTANSIYYYRSGHSIAKSVALHFRFFQTPEEAVNSIKTSTRGRVSYTKTGDPTRTTTKRDYIRNYDWDSMLSKCQLAREFEEGTRWVHYRELFHLILNYGKIKGGIKRLHDKIDSIDWYDEGKNTKAPFGYKAVQHARIDTAHAYNYLPSNCSNRNCPFFDQCESTQTNIVNLGREDKLGVITVTENYRREYESLDEVNAKVKAIFEDVLANGEEGIHIIQAQTGLGKTEHLVNADYSGIGKVKLALPTHDLKKEVVDRLIASGQTPLVTPKRPELPDEESRKEYEHLLQLGLTKKAHAFYHKKAKELAPNHSDLKEYLDLEKRGKNNKSSLLVTTHERALLSDIEDDVMIYDEDIFNSVVKVDTITVNEIDTLATILSRYVSLRPFFEEIQCNIRKEKELYLKGKDVVDEAMVEGDQEAGRFTYEPRPFSRPVFTYDLDKVAEDIFQHRDKFKSNIMDFLTCHFYRLEDDLNTVLYVKRRHIPNYKKIIILSATANEKVWRMVYGSQVKFYQTGLAKNTGRLIQVANNSYSRTDLTKNMDQRMELINKVLSEGNVKNVITFKSLAPKFEKAGYNVIAHFGATSGIDAYKGKDLAVIGTYHVNPGVHKLVGVLCGITDFSDMERRVIERNGFKFTFMTYDNPDLREIQFYYIESELQQAIGRARLLRENCTVYVLSNLPIPEADSITVRGREVL